MTKDDRRKYIRLDTVFPVEFRFLGLDGQTFLSDWVQGFTRNISRGGICLEINNLASGLGDIIKAPGVNLLLKIEIPFMKEPPLIKALVAWTEQVPEANRYNIGLNYVDINTAWNNQLIRYSWFKKLWTPVVLTVIFLLGLGIAWGSYKNNELIAHNRKLVDNLVKVTEEFSAARKNIEEISQEKEKLELDIHKLALEIDRIEKDKEILEEKKDLEYWMLASQTDGLNQQIQLLDREKRDLENRLLVIREKEDSHQRELVDLGRQRTILEGENLDKMYCWLKVHQNPRTGLVMSFEGDSNIGNWAFIYDQALVAQVYLKFSDFSRTKKLLDFFAQKAKRSAEGMFYNAYYANDATPAEYIVHSGPNIWVGIASLHYIQKTNDRQYLKLAEDIAKTVIYLQNQDKDSGIRGGPNVSWYSTEHNLDAYAFLTMLHKITGKLEYKQAADKLINWFALHIYDKTDVPIRRGKGDSTIATDTYAWSVAAMGPQRLKDLGMDPEQILEFVETNCAIEVDYQRPEGRIVKVKGFDFAPQRHLARGGVVCSEWTAQMVVAFKIMADYYRRQNEWTKADVFEQKARMYLDSLAKMIISSPSPSGQGESCLSYATQDNVDTGHGWITAKGKWTGSVAGTAYMLLAYYNYNPLELDDTAASTSRSAEF